MLIFLAACAAVLLYIYVGYPLVLQLLVFARGRRAIARGTTLPRVSLVISAFNEADVIREKLRNALALDYPRDRLEVAVISDASDDGTDEAVGEFASEGVRLLRLPARGGKTAGLNRFVPELTGEIVVFSDANAMYDRQALRMLVRNFCDPAVGCVTGEARYLPADPSAAASGERAYWGYEIWIKTLETAVGSMVGGDGAIYAIRKALWQTLPDNAINDFLNPLQIVSAGWRGVYEPDAIAYEATAGDMGREWRRRVRIVSRSWRAVFQARGSLNPFRVGLFAFCLFSHKVLRWLSGVWLLGTAAFVATIAWHLLPSTAILAVLATTAALLLFVPPTRRVLGFGLYCLTISSASIAGVIRGVTGRVSGIWTPPRAAEAVPSQFGVHPGLGLVILALSTLGTAASLVLLVPPSTAGSARVVFWTSIALLAYVYAGYPVLLGILRHFARRPVQKAPILPRVCLFVAAHDERPVIEAKLRNCLEVDYPSDLLSIVVASDGSKDGTADVVRSFVPSGVTLVEFPVRRGKISAINDGLRIVDSEIVVFSDANTFLRPDAVRALVKNMADPTVGAVSGDVVLVGDRAALAHSEDLYYRYERWLQHAESDLGSMIGVDGALYAIRRELFVPPRQDTILDDLAIPMAVVRAGMRVVFEPTAIAHERGSESATEEFARKSRVVAGAIQFLLRRDSVVPLRNPQVLLALVSHKTLRWLSPVFALITLAASIRLGAEPLFLTVAVAHASFLLVGVLGCIPWARRWSVIGLAHYFLLVQAAAAVGLARGAVGRQSVAWRRFTRAPLQTT